jgi:hypothetical protein
LIGSDCVRFGDAPKTRFLVDDGYAGSGYAALRRVDYAAVNLTERLRMRGNSTEDKEQAYLPSSRWF